MNDQSFELWCLIEGDAAIQVTVDANKSIAILKDLVHSKLEGNTSVAPKDLVLLKVSDILQFHSNINIPFLRSISLSVITQSRLYNDSKSLKTSESLHHHGSTSPTSGQLNLLLMHSTFL